VSQFSDDYSSAAEDLDDYFGGVILYSDPATSVTAIDATIHRDRKERRKNSEGGFDWITTRDVYIYDRDEKKIPAIRRDGKVTIDGSDYAIIELGMSSESRRLLKLKRVEAAEVSRNNYRR